MTASLSPLTLANMQAQQLDPVTLMPVGAKLEACRVTAYECPICGDLHLDEDEAVSCCQSTAGGPHDQDGHITCPVCGAGHKDHHLAADCCLWHDIDAPTRWRIADAVEAGASWQDAIGMAAT